MARRRKYYDTKREANKAREALKDPFIHVWKMPKGSRHPGKYAVCDEMEYLNTY